MWDTKTFETHAAMLKWLEAHDQQIQWEEIAVENATGYYTNRYGS